MGGMENRQSAKISARGGASPSTHPAAPRGNSRSVSAKARWAAKARRLVHRLCHASCAERRSTRAQARARARASSWMNRAVSGLHRPPTSKAKTTNRARRDPPASSGYMRSLRRRARAAATPSVSAAPGMGSPFLRNGETRVTSMASWTPFQRGRLFATTSRRRPSLGGEGRFRSRTKTFVATRAPASRQIRAVAASGGNPRRTNTPDVEHAVRWSPRGSSKRRQRQRNDVGGRGKRSLRRRRTRKRGASKVVRSQVGGAVKTAVAPGPA